MPHQMELQAQPLMDGMEEEYPQAEVQRTYESDDMFNNLIQNLNSNESIQNEFIKQQFKLDLIKDEEDL